MERAADQRGQRVQQVAGARGGGSGVAGAEAEAGEGAGGEQFQFGDGVGDGGAGPPPVAQPFGLLGQPGPVGLQRRGRHAFLSGAPAPHPRLGGRVAAHSADLVAPDVAGDEEVGVGAAEDVVDGGRVVHQDGALGQLHHRAVPFDRGQEMAEAVLLVLLHQPGLGRSRGDRGPGHGLFGQRDTPGSENGPVPTGGAGPSVKPDVLRVLRDPGVGPGGSLGREAELARGLVQHALGHRTPPLSRGTATV